MLTPYEVKFLFGILPKDAERKKNQDGVESELKHKPLKYEKRIKNTAIHRIILQLPR